MTVKKENLIKLQDKLYQKCKVYMLPTDKKSVYAGQLVIGAGNHLFASRQAKDIGSLTAYNLYFTSPDEEIKEGDWGYDTLNNCIEKVDKATIDMINSKMLHNEHKKIIATTDKSLGITDHKVSPVPNFIDLPQPSKDFINVFIEEYNKGNQITDVLVEYEIIEEKVRSLKINNEQQYITQPKIVLKIDKNNTISIKKVKDTLKDLCLKTPELQEEVEALLYKATLDAVDNNFNFWNWLESNWLKSKNL